MPQLTRHYCSNCKSSIFNCMINGVRVPLVFYFVVGQAADTGPTLNVNGEGVQVPSFIREIMQTPTQRIELCMQCVSDIFGLPLLSAGDDPMYSQEQQILSAARVQKATETVEIDEVSTNAIIMARTLLAIKVGRGADSAPALPPTLIPAQGV